MKHQPQKPTDGFTPDPSFDALLSEALAPESVPGGIPEGLSRRIVAATDAVLATERDAGFGRVHSGYWGFAAAAAIAIAVGAAFWMTPPAHNTNIARDNNADALPALAMEMNNLDSFEGNHAALDSEMAMLSEKLDHASTDEDWASINASVDHVSDQLALADDIQ